MKNNKGFIGMGIILAIITVLAVGGIAYYVGKKSNALPKVEQNILPEVNQNDVANVPTPTPNPTPTTACSPTTTPWIKVTSPNGGETYTSGQQITVTWSKCNTVVNDQVTIILKSTQTGFGAEIATVPNTGTAIITLPTTLGGGQVFVTSGHYYKMRLELGGNAMGQTALLSDESDNLFTINAKVVTPTPINACLSTTTPWIKITSPNGGETYTANQQITIKWKSCNVQNVYLSSGIGGHSLGLFSETPISASLGSYQWTTPDSSYIAQYGHTGYWIGIESQSPNVQVQSGTFTIQ